MRKLILGLLLVLGTSTALLADYRGRDDHAWRDEHRQADDRGWRYDRGSVDDRASADDPAPADDSDTDFARVPEIDPTAGMAAIALIAGTVLVLRGRRPKKA